MDIMELGAIGELVGGLAVVGSLIYVGLQVRQSNRLAQADAVQAYVQTYNRDVLSPLQDQAFAQTLRRGLNDFPKLNREEQIVVHGHLAKSILLGQTAFFLRRHGLVHEDFAESRQAIEVAIVKSPGGTQWWRAVRQAYPPDYVAYLDRLVENSEVPAITEFFPWYGPDDPTEQDA